MQYEKTLSFIVYAYMQSFLKIIIMGTQETPKYNLTLKFQQQM